MNLDMEYYNLAVPFFVEGFKNTVLYCLVALAGALPLSVVIALMRLSRRAALRLPALWFVEIVRNIPFLILVFLIFALLPSLGFRSDPITLGMIALTAFGAAMFSESVRGAILSVPRGQLEAARATGMPYLTAMHRIVAPQMMGYFIPSLTNQLIGMIKESSLLSIVGVAELTLAADNITGMTFVAAKTYMILALVYWGITGSLAVAMKRLERRFASRGSVLPANPIMTKTEAIAR